MAGTIEMTNITPNMRKAAVMLRTLDGDTAALMLGQLSPNEAAAIRSAMRALGPIDVDEQAEVVAELRGDRPQKNTSTTADVELSLSSSYKKEEIAEQLAVSGTAGGSKRFEFLERAPTAALVPYLAREHVQTIAVVLSHLPPQRAAAILDSLPQKLQAETSERLSTLGETDPESVVVLERELAAWVALRSGGRPRVRRDTMAAILAAADAKTRSRLLSNLKNHDVALANQVSANPPAQPHSAQKRRSQVQKQIRAGKVDARRENRVDRAAVLAALPLPRVKFDDLIHLDSRTLASILRQADANVLALALVGSRDELVDRICEQMPKRTARAFRRELRRLGPTRLSDVEAAQQAVAHIAERQFAEQQRALLPAHC